MQTLVKNIQEKRLGRMRAGFTLLELILAVAIFSATAIATGYLIIEAMSTTDANSKKIQATLLAKEGIEAVRLIRDNEGILGLPNGDHGLTFNAGAREWSFLSDSDTTDDIYVRVINISAAGTDRKLVQSTVSVPTLTREIVVSLVTEVSAWPEL